MGSSDWVFSERQSELPAPALFHRADVGKWLEEAVDLLFLTERSLAPIESPVMNNAPADKEGVVGKNFVPFHFQGFSLRYREASKC